MPLELDCLVKRYGKLAAVDGISLRIEDGEFFSLLGPSGCGKTTLLRSIAGIVPPDAGHVWLDGTDITRAPLHARDITLVFQSYALFPHRTVFDNIAFGLVMRGEGKPAIRDKVEKALALVRLSGLGERYPAQISGGQQQRVALARALVVRPKVLLLDEPLSNLDTRLREEMRDELKEIQRQVGITTILVTHDIQEAFALSDRIAVLNHGRVEQIGRPIDIYRAPQTRFVAHFAGPTNEFEGRVDAIEAGIATVATGNGQHLRARVVDAALAKGTKVTVIVRPESFTVSPGHGTGDALNAMVRRVTYLGNTTRLHLDAAGARLIADLPMAGEALVAIDGPVNLTFRAGDGVVLPAGSAVA